MAATSCGCGLSLQPSTSVGTRQKVCSEQKIGYFVKLSIVADCDGDIYECQGI